MSLRSSVSFSLFSPVCLAACSVVWFSGCAGFMPKGGPAGSALQNKSDLKAENIRLVEVDGQVARNLAAQRAPKLFSQKMSNAQRSTSRVERGDSLEVAVVEAPPAALFGGGALDAKMGSAGSHLTTFPEQMVNTAGNITVPFAGSVPAAGRTVQEIQDDVSERLKDKANQAQVIVRQTKNTSAYATVVGEVKNSMRVPLTPGGERVLDALALAGGATQPVNKMMLRLSRGSAAYSLPLESIIADPKQNVVLRPGDVLTAVAQPLSFTALGATGKNEEIQFEAKGITLAQALARSGGLIDLRASNRGVYVFRFEPGRSGGAQQPVIYHVDLSEAASFFIAKTFPISDGDVLYVSSAKGAELQKFVNILSSVAFPTLSAAATASAFR
jgi:polysaccharide export outer membrane protein